MIYRVPETRPAAVHPREWQGVRARGAAAARGHISAQKGDKGGVLSSQNQSPVMGHIRSELRKDSHILLLPLSIKVYIQDIVSSVVDVFKSRFPVNIILLSCCLSVSFYPFLSSAHPY